MLALTIIGFIIWIWYSEWKKSKGVKRTVVKRLPLSKSKTTKIIDLYSFDNIDDLVKK